MPGRVYQIDAGWMGGAASIGYGQLPFWFVEFEDMVSTDVGVAGPTKGSMFLSKMLTRCGAWRIFPRNSKRLAAEEICSDAFAGGAKA